MVMEVARASTGNFAGYGKARERVVAGAGLPTVFCHLHQDCHLLGRCSLVLALGAGAWVAAWGLLSQPFRAWGWAGLGCARLGLGLVRVLVLGQQEIWARGADWMHGCIGAGMVRGVLLT